jgi:type II secretory pathway pseudopilin PulG
VTCRQTIPRNNQTGFTYLVVLFGIVLIGLSLAGTATIWSTVAKRKQEQELLWVGAQFRLAIQRYYLQGPGGVQMYPRSLDELLEDHRWPEARRHLRKMYADPLTGQVDWQLATTPDGQIVGVYSPSMAAPLKRAGFSGADFQFSEAKTYADWQFVYLPQLVD